MKTKYVFVVLVAADNYNDANWIADRLEDSVDEILAVQSIEVVE